MKTSNILFLFFLFITVCTTILLGCSSEEEKDLNEPKTAQQINTIVLVDIEGRKVELKKKG